MRMYDIIAKKRDGQELSHEELKYFISGYCTGEIPDYQAAAFLMAVFLRGMNIRETSDLTMLMADSGDKTDLSAIKGIKVDKHSTGGVGDKTTLVTAPIVAACGTPVAKMSGRGLGHTGGTIDKLESIPGLRTALGMDEFISNVQKIGIAIAGQTSNLAPADKKLYALRDVTATVDNVSLIASSIMSKKLASGADKIVLDVKTGSGAFMKSVEQAVELAEIMVNIGSISGRETIAIVTGMDKPLGYAIGNSLEVIEAIHTLKGNGPKDLEEVSFELAARMLELAGAGTYEQSMIRVKEAVESGRALKKLTEMIENQHGDSRVVENEELFEKAEVTYDVYSEYEGYVEHTDTLKLGIASMVLGAGRERKESIVDYSAGIVLKKKTGMKVKKGDLLATLYTSRSSKLSEAERILRESFKFSSQKPVDKPLIVAYVDSKGVKNLNIAEYTSRFQHNN